MADKVNPNRHSKGSSGGGSDKSKRSSKKTRRSDDSEGKAGDNKKAADNKKKLRKTSNDTEEQRHIMHTAENSNLDRTEQTDVPAPVEDGVNEQQPEKSAQRTESGDIVDVLNFIPLEAIKTVQLLRNKKRRPNHKNKEKEKPKKGSVHHLPGPIASKVIYLKTPEEEPKEDDQPKEPEEDLEPMPLEVEPHKTEILPPTSQPDEEPSPYLRLPMLLFGDSVGTLMTETKEDQEIEKRLDELIEVHRREKLRKLKQEAKARNPDYKFGEMITTLTKLGIPCPTNEDFEKLHGLHSRWDPDGTIIEYFSPMLRTFIPINMRGRYRGCWPSDTCMKGVDISKVSPKRDALEGFVERGRHDNIQQKYDEMSQVAVDEAHLDFLIELQAYQAETLPIPIFYDMLHLGIEVANETLRIFVQEEGYPPNNYIFGSALKHAEQLRRKIQLYGALGLESLGSKRKGLGAYLPQWLKSRDEIIRDIMKSKDGKRYQNFEKMEAEGKEREKVRREQTHAGKSVTSARKSNLSTLMKKMTGKLNKVEPGQQDELED